MELCGSRSGVCAVSICLGLDGMERAYINCLECDHGIVWLKGRVFVPLHVKFSKIQARKGLVTDSRLRDV